MTETCASGVRVRTGPLAAVDPDLDGDVQRRLRRIDADLPLPGTRVATGCRAVGWSAIGRVGWRIAMVGLALTGLFAGALPVPVRVIIVVGATAFWLTLHWFGRPWVSTRRAVRDLRRGLVHAVDNRVIARCAGRYLLREQLDASARSLFDRAVTAMETVRTSALATDGVIDAAAVASLFGGQRWALAEELERQTEIRRRLDGVPAPFGRYTATVVAVQRTAVCEAEAASTALVTALEQYAEHVGAADLAYLDRLQARDLSANDDACLDLRAGIAGTKVRAAGLEQLMDQIRTIADALSDGVPPA